jgi:DNA-binding NtrC family response regulator
MRDLRTQIERYADTPFPVLVHGESGTGKELVAKLLHDVSDRAREPFLTLNCAAFTPDLLEAQLFGNAKGAFTGAVSARAGFFEDAGNGTLLLDEIGEFPVHLQPKLLRVLENGEFYRIGETRARTANARIIAATNRDLQYEIREGRFRQDLFHRLGVLAINIPPLRVRGEDRLLLLDHFRELYAAQVTPFTLDEDARARWLGYSFPGNVRELRNIVIRLGAKYPGAVVALTELEAELDSASQVVDTTGLRALQAGEFKLDDILSNWEQRYIEAALRLADDNLSEAARLLGVNRTTLYSKIQRLGKESSGHV